MAFPVACSNGHVFVDVAFAATSVRVVRVREIPIKKLCKSDWRQL
jgi:hypothetical protein